MWPSRLLERYHGRTHMIARTHAHVCSPEQTYSIDPHAQTHTIYLSPDVVLSRSPAVLLCTCGALSPASDDIGTLPSLAVQVLPLDFMRLAVRLVFDRRVGTPLRRTSFRAVVVQNPGVAVFLNP
eukprot:GHVU01209042.1.p1 GENE.GHVU01209042.1~~GHVU01209042.1.p1  ORF type:complete len:125 (+),score=2.50 GHVU01209042.1:277-651(+)